MSFIKSLGARLVAEFGVHDLTRNAEFSMFHFIGIHDAPERIDLVAFVNADNLTEKQIVNLRDTFFSITQTLPKEFRLNPHFRNPKGLLGFVFSQEASDNVVNFIKKQSKIDNFNQGGILISWVIDRHHQKIHTHNNPISFIPPVFIPASDVFPKAQYLQDFVKTHQEITKGVSQPEPLSRHDHLIKLYKLIAKHLDADEFRNLCFEVNIPPGELQGDVISSKAASLVQYLEKQERIPELVIILKKWYPRIDWE